jgi:hypothetical protein
LSDADPYARLAELAEAAAALAEQGRVEELDAIFERSGAIAASLPARPPRSARPQLERAAAAQERLGTTLGASLDATRAELELIDRGRRATRSYGGPPAAGLNLQA